MNGGAPSSSLGAAVFLCLIAFFAPIARLRSPAVAGPAIAAGDQTQKRQPDGWRFPGADLNAFPIMTGLTR